MHVIVVSENFIDQLDGKARFDPESFIISKWGDREAFNFAQLSDRVSAGDATLSTKTDKLCHYPITQEPVNVDPELRWANDPK